MKRYTLTVDQCGALYAQPVGGGPDIEPEEASEWVRYEDLVRVGSDDDPVVDEPAWLRNEVRRLRGVLRIWSTVHLHNVKLKAAVERLRDVNLALECIRDERPALVASLAAANAAVERLRVERDCAAQQVEFLCGDVERLRAAQDELFAQREQLAKEAVQFRDRLAAANALLELLWLSATAEERGQHPWKSARAHLAAQPATAERIRAETDAGVAEFGVALADEMDCRDYSR